MGTNAAPTTSAFVPAVTTDTPPLKSILATFATTECDGISEWTIARMSAMTQCAASLYMSGRAVITRDIKRIEGDTSLYKRMLAAICGKSVIVKGSEVYLVLTEGGNPTLAEGLPSLLAAFVELKVRIQLLSELHDIVTSRMKRPTDAEDMGLVERFGAFAKAYGAPGDDETAPEDGFGPCADCRKCRYASDCPCASGAT